MNVLNIIFLFLIHEIIHIYQTFIILMTFSIQFIMYLYINTYILLIFFSTFLSQWNRQYTNNRDDGSSSDQRHDSGSIAPTADVQQLTHNKVAHDDFADIREAVMEIENRDSFENLAKALANALESDTLNPSMSDLLGQKIM